METATVSAEVSELMTSFDRFIVGLIGWGVVCSIAAIPSFVIATDNNFDQAGMGAGVLVFVVIYAAISSTEPFRRRWQTDRAFAHTVVVGYSLRLLVSAIVPVGMFLDMFPGMIAVDIVGAMDFPRTAFVVAFLTTLVQGFLLNVILAMFMGMLYVVIKPFVRRPEQQRRGFMVIQPDATPSAVPPSHPSPQHPK